MFEVLQTECKGIRTDRGPKFIGAEFCQNIVNYNFDNIIGLSRISAPNVEYDAGGTDGIDGLFQFRYINSSGNLQKENIIVQGGDVIKDGVVVVKDGEIKNYTWGKTQVVKPEYDATIEKKLKKYFDKYHTIALPNYSISNDEMAEVIGSDINEVKCSRKRIS